jgi:natural product biosynthesis luciferase-like monooxygenase protein
MTERAALFIGDDSLLVHCAEHWLGRGFGVAAVATGSPEIRAWAEGRGLRVEPKGAGLAARAAALELDWLFSVTNLDVLPETMIAAARAGAVNFHDGPLPRRAGLAAPVWALLEGDGEHGVTWHRMTAGVDAGDVLEQRLFEIAPEETALTLNAKCYEAAIESFAALAAAIAAGGPQGRPQDLARRSFHARDDRPRAAARLDFARPAAEVLRLVRALDHGGYANPLAVPKIEIAGRVLAVGAAAPAPGAGAPGEVLAADAAGLTLACAEGAVTLRGLRDLADGAEVDPAGLARPGERLPALTPEAAARIDAALAAVAPAEARLRAALRGLAPARLPLLRPASGAPDPRRLALAPADPAALLAGFALLAAALDSRAALDLALADAGAPDAPGYVSDWVPLRVAAAPETPLAEARARLAAGLAQARRRPAFAADLALREPGLGRVARPEIGVFAGADAPVPGAALTLALPDGAEPALRFDAARLAPEAAALLAARLAHLAAAIAAAGADAVLGDLPSMPEAERDLVLHGWNRTATSYDRTLTVHAAIAAQAARTPEATALVHEATTLSYAELEARANRAAQVLRAMGVGPGTPVGLATRRSALMAIGALAIWKAGGAYVPLDPAYPADRIALTLEDSAAPVIVTDAATEGALPAHAAQVLVLDADPRIAAAPATPPEGGAGPQDLAYLIYTSGSTGRPKGVMVEHRNVVNFFAGMDARVPADPAGTWLAVTSLAFDISVLELFWTLARGFKVVVMGDAERALVAGGRVASARRIDFSLFYWGNDDGAGPKKYELLLEGAKFADANGFCAVWTPERHFHAFGGPYPNPAVTGAAVAAVTKTIGVRAGSCVAPLHHPARIAEDWAVIDNLTGGRAGLAIASGWQPDDFVLRPENTPPANRRAMLDAIDVVRRLWRGEAVEFPTASGKPFAVVTQPRPVSTELPVWVTTAGNPETWREAGRLGANVLTHLLGQTIDEVAEKIALYHDALRAAGHDPADHVVTLMLHSYLAADRETARETARGPMKDYLRSAAALIKQYAWAFPAFKKPAGVTTPLDIDLQSLSEEEMEAILDFAFQRYFEDSGLFGTVEDALERVEALKRIGVDEIACLIDYGIPAATVMAGLAPLAEVLARANAAAGPAADDFSIAAQIVRHGVTHLQCTPSMARMIATNEESRAALAGLRRLLVGGEALPGALVADLARATRATVENMYGPTETTIWSSTGPADAADSVVGIGTPIANTRLYVLDAAGAPVPVGVAGELWIGGEGVARGYWRRDDLTAERFRPDPFAPEVTPGGAPGRMYRSGDLVRRRADGGIDFLGRADQQVKLRGHRIELGEIEAAAEAFPGVRQVVVAAHEAGPGDLRLVAYLVGAPGLAPEALRAHLAAKLPEHMVPSHVVRLDALPLTPNGKVDRKALPAPGDPAAAAPAAEAYAAPEGDVAAAIAGVWSRVLNVPRIGARDNFFALGGHSLLAVQAHREIRQALGTSRLSITDIFRFPTLEALAAHLDGGPKGAAASEGPDPQLLAAAQADAMSKRRALRAGRGA